MDANRIDRQPESWEGGGSQFGEASSSGDLSQEQGPDSCGAGRHLHSAQGGRDGEFWSTDGGSPQAQCCTAPSDESPRTGALTTKRWGLLMTPSLWFIRFYQKFISGALPPSCRFQPSCSEYTRQALQKYGGLRGWMLGIRRLTKCHPFHPGGYDPLT